MASLIPLLWPAALCEYALEAVDETVGVRLIPYELEYAVYADELVDAVEFWRNGFSEVAEESICDRRKLLKDITFVRRVRCVWCTQEWDSIVCSQTCADAWSVSFNRGSWVNKAATSKCSTEH